MGSFRSNGSGQHRTSNAIKQRDVKPSCFVLTAAKVQTAATRLRVIDSISTNLCENRLTDRWCMCVQTQLDAVKRMNTKNAIAKVITMICTSTSTRTSCRWTVEPKETKVQRTAMRSITIFNWNWMSCWKHNIFIFRDGMTLTCARMPRTSSNKFNWNWCACECVSYARFATCRRGFSVVEWIGFGSVSWHRNVKLFQFIIIFIVRRESKVRLQRPLNMAQRDSMRQKKLFNNSHTHTHRRTEPELRAYINGLASNSKQPVPSMQWILWINSFIWV